MHSFLLLCPHQNKHPNFNESISASYIIALVFFKLRF